MVRKKITSSLVVVLFSASMANMVHATSIASASVDWNTFVITADSSDVTNSINWTSQWDSVQTSYREGRTGSTVNTDYSIFPNTNWAASQKTRDGITAKANTDLSNNKVSVSTIVDYTGNADSSIIRHGEFIADAATYTFNLDYSLSAEVNSTNTELGGRNFTPFSFPYVELLVINETAAKDPNRSTGNANGSSTFFYTFDDTVDISNTFDVVTNTGTLTASHYFRTDLFNFLAGDVITIDLTTQVSSRNYSSATAPVPLPSAIVFLVTGVGVLLSGMRHGKVD